MLEVIFNLLKLGETKLGEDELDGFSDIFGRRERGFEGEWERVRGQKGVNRTDRRVLVVPVGDRNARGARV